jgi:hypothetical protein
VIELIKYKMKQQLSLLIISFSQLAQAQTAPPGDRELFKRSTPRLAVGNGEKCGFETSINGSTFIPMCDPNVSGLTCVGSNLAQNQPGVCRLLVGVGEKCEGFTRPENRTFCEPGLTCVFPPNITQIPDLPGVCQAITTSTVTATATQTTGTSTPTLIVVGNGEDCDFQTSMEGKVAGTICKTELTCTSNSHPNEASQSGVCRLLVGVGEKCEGFTRPENRTFCEPGLTCVFPPNIIDLPGVCQAKTTSTVRPTQTSTVVYPTDVVVGSAIGITAFSFASMIALFL